MVVLIKLNSREINRTENIGRLNGEIRKQDDRTGILTLLPSLPVSLPKKYFDFLQAKHVTLRNDFFPNNEYAICIGNFYHYNICDIKTNAITDKKSKHSIKQGAKCLFKLGSRNGQIINAFGL